MTGKLYIDGLDAYSTYGVIVRDTGYAELVSYPPLKKVDSNDWPDEDGIEVDLENPCLDRNEFQILFGCVNNVLIGDFIALLSDGAYHEFYFAEIGLTKKLRLVSQSEKRSLRNLELFSLQFADDFPIGHIDNDYVYQPPVGYPGIWQNGHYIDGVDLSSYGIWVLDGTHDEILKLPAVKSNLLTMNSTTPGATYDGENVYFKEKDVTLKLCARASSLSDFWRNYNALLYNLVQPDERRFYYGAVDGEFPCHYKNSKVSRFTILMGEVWCDFTLTLVFTSFRLGETDILLATEEGELVVTEDGEYYINLG